MHAKLYLHSRLTYRLHSIIIAIVIPAVYFPHYEIDFNIFDVAIFVVSERNRKYENNSLVWNRKVKISSFQV